MRDEHNVNNRLYPDVNVTGITKSRPRRRETATAHQDRRGREVLFAPTTSVEGLDLPAPSADLPEDQNRLLLGAGDVNVAAFFSGAGNSLAGDYGLLTGITLPSVLRLETHQSRSGFMT